MTEEDKKSKLQEYTNTCAKIGDLSLVIDVATNDLNNFKQKAQELLKELKSEVPTPNPNQ